MNEGLDIVTGGAGFIGSHLAGALLKRGRRVRIIDDFSTGRRNNLRLLEEEFAGRLEVIRGDVRDLPGLKKFLQGAEVVYHQAAIPSVQRSVSDPLGTHTANVDGTLNVFLAARDCGVSRVVYASSSSVYGDSEELPKREEMYPLPMSPYGVSKLVSEFYGAVFSRLYNLPAVGLRYFNVFGPRQDPTSEYAAVIPRFITRMLDGKRPVIYGDGEQSRDFTFVENVVGANLRAGESDACGVSVNIACGQRITLNQLVQSLNQILGTDFEALYEPPRPGDIRHSQADISRAEAVLGYRVEVPFEEGLRRTVRWFQEQPKGETER